MGPPPLFLTQRQHQQLERSFTDPYKRRIAALEEQIAELNKAGKFPVYADYLNDDVTAEENSIFFFTWPDGAGEESDHMIELLHDYHSEDEWDELHVDRMSKSAVLVFTASTHSVWYGDDRGNVRQWGQILAVKAHYNTTYNHIIIHLY